MTIPVNNKIIHFDKNAPDLIDEVRRIMREELPEVFEITDKVGGNRPPDDTCRYSWRTVSYNAYSMLDDADVRVMVGTYAAGNTIPQSYYVAFTCRFDTMIFPIGECGYIYKCKSVKFNENKWNTFNDYLIYLIRSSLKNDKANIIKTMNDLIEPQLQRARKIVSIFG